MSLPSKLARGVAGYLVSASVGTWSNIAPLFSSRANTYPNVTVVPASLDADPSNPGLYKFQLNISIKGSNAKDPNSTNPEAGRVAFDALTLAVDESLALSSDGKTLRATKDAINTAARALAVAVDGSDDAVQFAANNADMANFSIVEWNNGSFKLGTADEEGCSWEQVIVYSGLCCASNVD